MYAGNISQYRMEDVDKELLTKRERGSRSDGLGISESYLRDARRNGLDDLDEELEEL